MLALRKEIFLGIGPAIALTVYIAAHFSGLNFQPAFTLGITTLCAIWWVSEAIPIPVTALIPLSVLPLSGVLSRADIINALGNPIHFLVIGGFMLSLAMVNSSAHMRIATVILGRVKIQNNRHLVWTFMGISAFLSMWMSNVATTLMLLPVAIAILDRAKNKPALSIPLLLGVTYAASIGGMSTPIGTPSNLIFIEIYHQFTGQNITFLQWMQWVIPLTMCLLPIAAWKLTRKLKLSEHINLPEKGPWQPAEKRVLIIFFLTALLWLTRTAPFGGWSHYLGITNSHDGYVALIASIALFITQDGKGRALLDWEATQKLPWGIILLVAGGLALSTAVKHTGLLTRFTSQLEFVSGVPTIYIILAVCLSVSFITEFMSNAASTALLMPILAATAIALNLDPLLIMMPAVLSANCAFMMPIATPSNAIVFATNRIHIQDMMKQGLLLNLICASAIAMAGYALFR